MSIKKSLVLRREKKKYNTILWITRQSIDLIHCTRTYTRERERERAQGFVFEEATYVMVVYGGPQDNR